MPDKRFFRNVGPFSAKEIIKALNDAGLKVAISDNNAINKKITDVASLDQAGPEEISFIDNRKYIKSFENTKAGFCLVHPDIVHRAHPETCLIITDSPYSAYSVVAAKFYPHTIYASPMTSGTHPSAIIDPSAKIGKNCDIGPHCVISANTVIGDNCTITANVFIAENVAIGNNCTINSQVTVSFALIGNNVIIHQGACIGQDGFGYAFYNGRHVKIPQLGRVIIEDDVEIGAGTCIDRGSGPDTIIGAGTRIDNLVQIGHNAKIGKGCVIVAQVGISGSTKIGDYAVLGGQAGIAGHLEVGSGAQIAAQSGVTKNIMSGDKVCGMPAVPIRQFHRQVIMLERMVKKDD